MLTPVLQNLLILQDRDLKRHALETQMKAVPEEIAQVERKIASEKSAIEAARTELRDLEVRKKSLETEIGSTETKLANYRTQQLSIRKNDEYQAMGHQIELTQAAVADLEGKELEVMYAIDGAKARFAAAEAELKANIAGHESRIATLRERDANLRAELTTAQAEVAAARNFPVVVPIHGAKCGGCHLKVSSEVESAARGKTADPVAQLPTCDQCGRIVYWES